MRRRFIAQLGENEAVGEIYRASKKSLRPNRHGQLYLQLLLSDRSGTIEARAWNSAEALYRSFEDGDFVRVEGTTQVFQGGLQIIAKRIERVSATEVIEDDFFPLTDAAIARLQLRLRELLGRVETPALIALVDCFLSDEPLMQQLAEAPAALAYHHAYRGGLLEHLVTMLEMLDKAATCYPYLDRDLLAAGILLHDIGKLREMSPETQAAYTDEGELIGHIVLGTHILREKIRQAELLTGEPFPAELALRLEHMIVSHHGHYEFGSPKLPMTLEAVALHYLDTLDSKLGAFAQMLSAGVRPQEAWSRYHPVVGRKLFRGLSREEDARL